MDGVELRIVYLDTVRQLPRLITARVASINVGPHDPVLRLNGVVALEVAGDVGRGGEDQLVASRPLAQVAHAELVALFRSGESTKFSRATELQPRCRSKVFRGCNHILLA